MSDPYPLRVNVTDPSEPFPLRFAERVAPLFATMTRVNYAKSNSGIVVGAIAERDLESVSKSIREHFPQAVIGPVEIVYVEDEQRKEPYVRVRVSTPDDYYGDVVADLNRRGGLIEHMSDASGEDKLVTATAPLAEVIGYETALTVLTRGTAKVEYEFIGYLRARPSHTPSPPMKRA
jgi:predicted membrane GTPase involved in stress response